MARYIDADELIEMCERMKQDPWNQGTSPHSWADAYDDFESDILRQPTADVVPKREVAREIFEEIEKVTARVYNDFMFNREGVGMKATYVVEFSDELDIALAELKKKYTEADNGV
jgi:hypothetical protein